MGGWRVGRVYWLGFEHVMMCASACVSMCVHRASRLCLEGEGRGGEG